MPDKLKAKVFTIFLKLPTSMKLFSGVSGLTQIYSFQLWAEMQKKFPLFLVSTGNSDAIDDVRDYL